MLQNTYKGDVPGSGYGSIDDDDEVLRGRAYGRPKGGSTYIAPEESEWPPRLVTRFYWNEPDQRMQLILGFDADPRLTYSFQATDLMLVETSESNELLAYVGMRPTARGFMSSVVESLRALVEEVDHGAWISTGSSPVGFGDDDFFRWLLYRYLWEKQIGRVQLKVINDITGRDGLFRNAALSKGADVDRPELLALMSGVDTFFGPAKVEVFDTALNLDASLELRQDGGFTPLTGSSGYTKNPPLPSQFRINLVNDLAFGTIPALRAAYYGDSKYRKGGRNRLLKHCREQLGHALASVAADGTCPVCGNVT